MTFKELKVGDTFYIYGDGEVLLKIPEIEVSEQYLYISPANIVYNTICLRECNHLFTPNNGKPLYEKDKAIYIFGHTRVIKC